MTTAALPTPKLVRRLEQYGFAALYFNRDGFEDHGEKLLQELTAMGRAHRLEGENGEQVVVLLEPKPQPRLPFAHSLTFGRGWQNAERDETRWAYDSAALSYFNPQARSVNATIRLALSGPDERQLRIVANGKEVKGLRVTTHRTDVEVTIPLRPGMNRIDILSAKPAVRLSFERGQLRAFALHASSVAIEGETPDPSS